jgi:hypothetical protein
MPQLTLYLDDATQEWPQDCFALAGRFADFPLREDAAVPLSPDAPRLQALSSADTATAVHHQGA